MCSLVHVYKAKRECFRVFFSVGLSPMNKFIDVSKSFLGFYKAQYHQKFILTRLLTIHFLTCWYINLIYQCFKHNVTIEYSINIFSALLLNGDSSFTQAKKPPCELNTLCVFTKATKAHIWPDKYI